ncbi:MAG TPA: lipopolysaccharide biosynthesis protein [Candidatus Acidoferrales bacterium]|nr:lipopolysaccharide biosynthesis protein [Candidatus Acidoferrales bacterium]
MKGRQIFLNAATTIAQTLGNACVLFFLYRFLIRSIGVERLGIWSLALATTSVITLANQGFSTSIVKFVAKYAARENAEDVAVLVQTAVISVALGIGVVSAGLYPAARWILHAVLPHARLAEAYAILPLAIASLWINILEGVLQAGLAGHQLITVCNYLEFAGGLSYLALAFALVPAHGLLGLAYAQAIQGLAILSVTWLLLRRRMPGLPFVPRRWSRAMFRELGGYGFHFQLITSTQALREPVTKALLARFGGLAMSGFYDLAARWIFTFRELIVQANQVLVPTISHLQERDPKLIPVVYRESYRIVFFLAVPTFASAALLSPLVSRVWIGRYEPIFVEFVAILAAGWLVNVLANPAYVADLGTGALKWVSVGCVVAATLNAVLGLGAGVRLGGIGVVTATAVSQATGYTIVLVAYHLENRISFRQLLPGESRYVVLASLIGAVALLPVFCLASTSSRLSVGAAEGALAVLMFTIMILMWRHPMRKQLFRWLYNQAPT